MEENDYKSLSKRFDKSPREWLEERGYTKTFLGWMPKVKWSMLVAQQAIINQYGSWGLTKKYTPSSVMKYATGVGELQLMGTDEKKSDNIQDFLTGLSFKS